MTYRFVVDLSPIAMDFNLLSTGVGRSMWDWLISHLTPCGTFSRRSMPQANARLPWLFMAEVSLSSSYYPVAFCRHPSVLCQPKQTLTVYTERPLILFLLLLRFLVSPADCPFPAPIVLIAGKYFIAKLIPLIIQIILPLDAPDTLCPKRCPSMLSKHFRISPYWYELVKVHVPLINLLIYKKLSPTAD